MTPSVCLIVFKKRFERSFIKRTQKLKIISNLTLASWVELNAVKGPKVRLPLRLNVTSYSCDVCLFQTWRLG